MAQIVKFANGKYAVRQGEVFLDSTEPFRRGWSEMRDVERWSQVDTEEAAEAVYKMHQAYQAEAKAKAEPQVVREI